MTKATYKQIEFDGRHNSDGGTAPDVQSFSRQKELLTRICQDTNEMRRDAIERELLARGVGYHVLKDGTLVIPAKKHDRKDIVAVCAHYDVVPGSKGYNDNGMSIKKKLELLSSWRCFRFFRTTWKSCSPTVKNLARQVPGNT